MSNDSREKGLGQQVLNNFAEHLAENDLMGLFPNKEDYASFLQGAFSQLLNKVMLKERDLHLQENSGSVGNGFSPPRTFRAGTLPLEIQIPRTRDDFYPSTLPKYKRSLPGAYEDLLYSLLLGAKSFSSIRNAVHNLGLGYSHEKLNELVDELYQEAKEFNSRPLSPDWLFIFIDAKVIHMKDEAGVIKKGVHFIATGVNMDAEKEILATKLSWKRETLEAWRELLIGLKNRGITRVLMMVTDDFSGLSKLIAGLFPETDHQLCTVHLQRNAYRHLSKEDYQYFQQKMKEILSSSSFDMAYQKLMELCEKLGKKYKGFIDNVRGKAENFTNFAKYPQDLWGHIRTTNMPEGLNNEIEKIKRESGGYFHTEKELMVKMRIMTIRLYKGKWKKPTPAIRCFLYDLTQMFYKRFEGQLHGQSLYTQGSVFKDSG